MKNKLFIGAAVMGSLAMVIAGVATASAAGFGGGMWAGSNGGSSMTPPAAVGKVTAVSGDTITLASMGKNGSSTYSVDATNATVMKNGTSSSVSAIATGDMIAVDGTVNGTSITATSIMDGVRGGMGGGFGRGGSANMHQPGIFGTVASVNGTTITVTSKAIGPRASSSTAAATTYTVNASTATVTKNGASSTLSSVAVGDTVMVSGTVSGATVTATSIRDGVVPGMGGMGMGHASSTPVIQGNGEPVVGGAVTAVNGTSITVTNKSNVTYTIDVSSATIEKGHATTTASSVAVGDNVLVQGTVNGTSITASSVIDQGAATSSTSGAMGGGPKGIIGAIGGFFQHIFGFF